VASGRLLLFFNLPTGKLGNIFGWSLLANRSGARHGHAADVANGFATEFFPTVPVIDLWYGGAAREWDQ
jgi:hypothetical protein